MNTQTTKNSKAILALLPGFIMSKQDIEALNSLPDNLPDTSLTGKQKDLVDELYYKYIGQNKVTYGWGNDLYELEQKEKWPSGQKVKTHEAKRMLLGWLVCYNTYYKQLTGRKALEFLHKELSCREASSLFTQKVYVVK